MKNESILSEEILPFVREVCKVNIKKKEEEFNRSLSMEDIPHCFSTYAEGNKECLLCVLSKGCSLWKDRQQEVNKVGKPVEPEMQETIKKEDVMIESETKKEESVVEQPKVDEKPVEVQAETKPVEQSKVEEASVVAGVEETPEEEKKDAVKKEKKGFIKKTVLEMLSNGTTKKELDKFITDLGYGKAGMNYQYYDLRKKGKIEERDGKLFLKE